MEGFRRPKAVVLPATASVPSRNLVQPPARLTHVLRLAQPYYYASNAKEPAGSFDAGAEVALVSKADPLCRVVDARGLSVFTSCAGLRAKRAK